MTAEQIVLIKKTWNKFRGVDPAMIGEVFYTRLFYTSPRLRKMFNVPMTEQYKKLIDMLSLMVSRLDRLDEITDDIKQLAARHADYGVKASHYQPVGEALLWTLEKGLGNDWTPEVQTAWTNCYQLIADSMIAEAVKKPAS